MTEGQADGKLPHMARRLTVRATGRDATGPLLEFMIMVECNGLRDEAASAVSRSILI